MLLSQRIISQVFHWTDMLLTFLYHQKEYDCQLEMFLAHPGPYKFPKRSLKENEGFCILPVVFECAVGMTISFVLGSLTFGSPPMAFVNVSAISLFLQKRLYWHKTSNSLLSCAVKLTLCEGPQTHYDLLVLCMYF